MKTYKFISDPGHGWLAVPIRDFLKHIDAYKAEREKMGYPVHESHKDYIANATTVFLEEGCQAPPFMDATGCKYRESYSENATPRKLSDSGGFASINTLRHWADDVLADNAVHSFELRDKHRTAVTIVKDGQRLLAHWGRGKTPYLIPRTNPFRYLERVL